MRTIRAEGAGIVRLLLFAFALQLAAPLLGLGGVAAQAGEAALNADLRSSLCHDSGNTPSPDGMPGPVSQSQVKHCIFCLPMAGDPAATGTELQAPAPATSAAIGSSFVDDQIPRAASPAFARSRAPPSSPRTV